ncbi:MULTISPECIES: sigma factor-like helix-turn-helix DNA-binding protein [Actinomadura]|uniref:Sigma factor-like helix-turn-helix DNA-binding protein n=1 Tax=Actinomadura yumaensis TaxID=111807 RepID=A0ABW2CMB9_9ACTN|nr:sigma factor-like helix-turn-helix DNA-binding protein [Actinomadura sp. J1-007]MWK38766.1 hypothetical protein [Actinomadura sp. J1-007]
MQRPFDHERTDGERVRAPGRPFRPPHATSPQAREPWLRVLRPQERLVVELVLWDHSQEQVAEFLDLPLATVRGIVERADVERRRHEADRRPDDDAA